MEKTSQPIFIVLKDLLEIQEQFLSKISTDDYTRKIESLGYCTIGNHTRHIIEFLEILVDGYDSEFINYDHRNRDENLENSPIFAEKKILKILENVEKPNKNLKLQQDFLSKNLEIASTYYRELLYNIEHCIHHQALIKVAILQLNVMHLVDDNFGVAYSTIKHKEICAH